MRNGVHEQADDDLARLGSEPNNATPPEPPIDRKNWITDVDEPTSSRSTAFCVATSSTGVTQPIPTPSTPHVDGHCAADAALGKG